MRGFGSVLISVSLNEFDQFAGVSDSVGLGRVFGCLVAVCNSPPTRTTVAVRLPDSQLGLKLTFKNRFDFVA